MLDVTESQLRVSARVGVPVRLSGMPVELVNPGFSTAIGLMLYVHRTRTARAAESVSMKARLRDLFAANF
jgi:cell division protein FtsA